jgi:hypothetical protein
MQYPVIKQIVGMGTGMFAGGGGASWRLFHLEVSDETFKI